MVREIHVTPEWSARPLEVFLHEEFGKLYFEAKRDNWGCHVGLPTQDLDEAVKHIQDHFKKYGPTELRNQGVVIRLGRLPGYPDAPVIVWKDKWAQNARRLALRQAMRDHLRAALQHIIHAIRARDALRKIV